jgi:alcohol dehydrogenase (NADP+)
MRLSSIILFTGLAVAQAPVTPPKGEQVTDLPLLGLGTWYMGGRQAPGVNGTEEVASAIQQGYRHIDGAFVYYNQQQIGAGIREGLRRTGLSRKDLWVTSKLWNSQ